MRAHLLRSNSYACAESWDDLVRAFTESLGNSSLDEMILLLHTTIPSPLGWRLGCVRTVSYDALDEVPKLLRSMPPNAFRTGATPTNQEQPNVGVVSGIRPKAFSKHKAKVEEQSNLSRGSGREVKQTKVNKPICSLEGTALMPRIDSMLPGKRTGT